MESFKRRVKDEVLNDILGDLLTKGISPFTASSIDMKDLDAITLNRFSNALKKRVKESERELEELKVELQIIEKQKEAMKKNMAKEVMDYDAPNSGELWPPFAKDMLNGGIDDFVYAKAKQFGRSTSSIRYKIIEHIVARINPTKWYSIGKRAGTKV